MLFRRSCGWWLQGRDEEALRYLESIRKYMDPAPWHAWLATLHGMHGRSDKSLEHFRQAGNYADHSFRAAANKGNALARSGRRRKALTYLQGHLRQQPDNFHAWSIPGIVLVQQGRKADVAKAFEQALYVNPESVAARQALTDLETDTSGP